MTLRDHIVRRLAAYGQPLDGWLLREGKLWPTGPMTFVGPRMAQGQCYHNAYLLAMRQPELTYVEGYVATMGIPIPHAFVLTPAGVVRDPTLVNHDGRIGEFFGVAFSTRYLSRAVMKNKAYGLLDAYYNRKTFRDLIEGRADFKPARETVE